MKLTTTGGAQTVTVGRAATYLVQNEGPADAELAGRTTQLGEGVLLPAGTQATVCLSSAQWDVLALKAPAGTTVRINRVG